MGRISDIDVQLFRIPLPEIHVDAKHGDHTHFELVTATIGLDDGMKNGINLTLGNSFQ